MPLLLSFDGALTSIAINGRLINNSKMLNFLIFKCFLQSYGDMRNCASKRIILT